MSIFDNIILELALIFAGASIIATIFLYLKQPIILAYIFLGMLVGPWGIGLFEDSSHIEHISHLGIILLMFLIGLNLHPQKLSQLLKKTALITLATREPNCRIVVDVFEHRSLCKTNPSVFAPS
ncbi:MAG: cation:proton antiporter domain-containing protein [Planctomycetota bacterium]|jgi:Kef-type K+ transport system membrane component KefB